MGWSGAVRPIVAVLLLLLLRPLLVAQLQPKKPLVNFEHHYINQVFSDDALRSLLQLVESRGVFKTTVDDATSLVEHIGEAVPVGHPDCDHPLMVRGGKNHSLCLLPSRVDVGRHHLMYGGRYGAKETYLRLVSRMLSFIAYIFDQLDTPVMKEMFDSPKYVKLATEICRGHSVFDPFQLNLILVLPGQELPMHWDVPWFWGATRFSIPQWLLVVMEQSGLFADLSVPQIQGVSWLHNTTSKPGSGGEFFYYPTGVSGEQKVVQAAYNHAIIVDGCRVAHDSSENFRVERFMPAAELPMLKKTERNELAYKGNHLWELRSNGERVRDYNTSDVRVSLVWRARCFASEEEKKQWHAQSQATLQLESVLDKLVADLRKRGRLAQDAPRPPPLELAHLLLDEYARYPIANTAHAWIPINYCMLPQVAPDWAKPLLAPLLNFLCDR